MANLPAAPINADPANDVDPRPAGDPDPAGGQFLGGMNQGGCQPGVGVNTGKKEPKVQDWSRDTIDPLVYNRVGNGTDLNPYWDTWPNTGVYPTLNNTNALVVEYPPVGDYNDTFAFVVADTQAAPGAQYDTVSGAVNQTDETIEIGEWSWGVVPVA